MMKKCVAVVLLAQLSLPLQAAEPAGRSRALYNEGMLFLQKSNYALAIRSFEQGLESARKLKNSRDTNLFLSQLGILYTQISDFNRAVYYLTESLAAAERLQDKGAVIKGLMDLGAAYRLRGDYRKAVSYYEDALKLSRTYNITKDTGRILSGIGGIYAQAGIPRKAMPFLRDAARLLERPAPKKDAVATLLLLADVYGSLYDYPKSAAAEAEALKAARAVRDNRLALQVITAQALTERRFGTPARAAQVFEDAAAAAVEAGDLRAQSANLLEAATLYRQLNDPATALQCYAKAQEAENRTADRARLWEIYAGRGALSLAAGESGEALKEYALALQAKKDAGLPTDDIEATVADIHFAGGDTAKAEAEYLRLNDSLRLGRAQLAKKNYESALNSFFKVYKEAAQSGDAHRAFASATGLGQAYLGMKDYSSAADQFRKAVQLFDAQERPLPGDERLETFEGTFWREPYDGLVRALVATNQSDEAFSWAERGKALSRMLARGGFVPDRESPAYQQEDYATAVNLRIVGRERDAMRSSKIMDDYRNVDGEYKALKEKRDRFIDDLRRTRPGYATLLYPVGVKPSDLRLADNEVLLSFAVTDAATYLFQIEGKTKKLKAREIPVARAALDDMTLRFRRFLEGNARDEDFKQIEAGKDLYELLLRKNVKKFSEDLAYIVVPDGTLARIPFEALPLRYGDIRLQGRHGLYPADASYLGDVTSFSYLPSACPLALEPQSAVASGASLAVSDPIFSKSDARLGPSKKFSFTASAGRRDAALRQWGKAAATGDELFPRLDIAEPLVQELKAGYGAASVVLEGAKANRDEINRLPAQRYACVLLASHVLLSGDVPYSRQPVVVLSRGTGDEGEAGLVTLDDLLSLRLDAPSVLLPFSGADATTDCREVLETAAALNAAGADHVLMGLWHVDREAAVQFCRTYITASRGGLAPAKAAATARTALRRAGYEHPAFWSGFILAGR